MESKYQNQDFIVPSVKRALVIGISDYSEWRLVAPSMLDLPFSKNDAKEVAKLLTQFGYDVTSNCSKDSTRAEFVKDIITDWIKEAKTNYDNGMYTHYFIYFSGHGVLSSDKNETCGVDSFGGLIPWDHYAKQFSQKPKTLAFFFLDQCRQMGISVVKYCCASGQLTANDTSAGKTLSKQTENFIGKLSKAFIRTHELIDQLGLVNLEWAIPKQEWGDWIIFRDTTGQLPASSFIPIKDEVLNKKIIDLIWDGDEDFARKNITLKDTNDYIYAVAHKTTQEFYHEEGASVGLGLTILTLGIMMAAPQTSEKQYRLKPNYPPHAEKLLVEELKREDVGPQTCSSHELRLRGETTEDPTFSSKIFFAGARPLQAAAHARFKVKYTCTYRVPKGQYRAKALKLLEKEQQEWMMKNLKR